MKLFFNVAVILFVFSKTVLASQFEWKENTLTFIASGGSGNSCLDLLSISERTNSYSVRPAEGYIPRDYRIEAEKVARLILDINPNLSGVGLPIPKDITVWLIAGDVFAPGFGEVIARAIPGRGISVPRSPIIQAHEYAHLVFDLAFKSALVQDGELSNNFLVSLAPQEVIRLARRRAELLRRPRPEPKQTQTDEEISKVEKMWDEEIWNKYKKLDNVTFIRQLEELFADTLAWAQLSDLAEYDEYIETIQAEGEAAELALLRVQLFDMSEAEKKAIKPSIKSTEEGLHKFRHNFYDDVRFWIGQRHKFSSTHEKYNLLVTLLRAISLSVDEAYRDQGPQTANWTAGVRDAANIKLIQKLMDLESND